MLRLVPWLIAGMLAASAAGSSALADPNIVYTLHVLKVDVHDLDLTRNSDQRILETRVQQAADQVCGGRPDQGNRYTDAELKRLLPAYDKCHADAVQRALAQLKVPAGAGLAQAGVPQPDTSR